jgi:hypothetical protein
LGGRRVTLGIELTQITSQNENRELTDEEFSIMREEIESELAEIGIALGGALILGRLQE